MALAIDGSSPAVVRNSNATTTTASFSPPAQSLLVAYVLGDAGDGSTNETCTVTSGGGLTWQLAVRSNGSPGATAEIWWVWAASAPGSITVSVTDNKGSVAKSLLVRVYTGADSAGIGATNVSHSALSCAYTSTVANSWGWGQFTTAVGVPAAGSGQTAEDLVTDFSFDGGDNIGTLKQNATTATPGSTVTMSITGPASLSQFAVAEILPAAVATIAPPPPRTIPLRDYGEAQWLQDDRRALDVTTATPSLPSPLDAAWGADGNLWHRHHSPETHTDRRQTAFQPARQTIYFGPDPDIPPLTLSAGAGGDLWHRYNDIGRDTRFRQRQRVVTDPSLLTVVPADPLVLAGAVTGDLWRRYNLAATHDERRLYPVQRAYVSDPSVLATALLENELLGGAETVKRHMPATHGSRWWMRHQRHRSSDPGLLSTALLENELLGGAESVKRQVAATHTARSWLPKQRERVSPPDLFDVPADPNVVGEVRRRRNAPAYWERRAVPPQRTYYGPPAPPAGFDPLTVAAGVGGDLWRRYHTPRTHTDRRACPAQPLRVTTFYEAPGGTVVLPPGLIPVRTFTTAEILVGNRFTRFRFDLYSRIEAALGNLEGVEKGHVDFTSSASVHSGGALEVVDNGQSVDWLNDRVKPVVIIEGLPEIALGMFVFSEAPEDWGDTGRSWPVKLLDKTSILDQDAVDETYALPAGTVITTAAVTLIASTGETNIAVTPSAATLSGPLTWPAGTTKLKIVNDLLSVAGYFSLFCNGDGQYIGKPYVRPAARPIRYEFLDGEQSIYSPDFVKDVDLFAIPNKFIAVGQGDAATAALTSTATNTDPDSPYSFANRGRWIVKSATGVEAASQTVLDDYARRRLIELTSPTSSIDVSHMLVPDLTFNDAVRLRRVPANVDARHVVTKMVVAFDATALVKSSLQEVVDL